ncbi:MAG: rhodanese-like domain-containing protein [Chitinophagaceae bacterium]|nr:rhodanese-like domain-containing protein [Chitinophagaceae bacterium]
MKNNVSIKLVFVFVIFLSGIKSFGQNPENWTQSQLMQPADLAKAIGSGKDIPAIFCVGPKAYIPGSVFTGMSKDKDKLDKLKNELKNLPKDKKIVVYCGCCPFDHCPNVRPAIQTLKDMKFTNYFLLNLVKNIKVDWIDKGYPVLSE